MANCRGGGELSARRTWWAVTRRCRSTTAGQRSRCWCRIYARHTGEGPCRGPPWWQWQRRPGSDGGRVMQPHGEQLMSESGPRESRGRTCVFWCCFFVGVCIFVGTGESKVWSVEVQHDPAAATALSSDLDFIPHIIRTVKYDCDHRLFHISLLSLPRKLGWGFCVFITFLNILSISPLFSVLSVSLKDDCLSLDVKEKEKHVFMAWRSLIPFSFSIIRARQTCRIVWPWRRDALHRVTFCFPLLAFPFPSFYQLFLLPPYFQFVSVPPSSIVYSSLVFRPSLSLLFPVCLFFHAAFHVLSSKHVEVIKLKLKGFQPRDVINNLASFQFGYSRTFHC